MKKYALLIIAYLFMLCAGSAFAVDFSGWSTYANNLHNCKPGTFDLPDPVAAAISPMPQTINYEIIGMKAGVCQVTVTRNIPNEPPFILNCKFTAANLPILAKSAMDISAGNVSSDDPAGKVMESSCKQAK